jgi:hypothetical protein
LILKSLKERGGKAKKIKLVEEKQQDHISSCGKGSTNDGKPCACIFVLVVAA